MSDELSTRDEIMIAVKAFATIIRELRDLDYPAPNLGNCQPLCDEMVALVRRVAEKRTQ